MSSAYRLNDLVEELKRLQSQAEGLDLPVVIELEKECYEAVEVTYANGVITLISE